MALAKEYFLGQGYLMMADRDAATGTIGGFVHVGNVPMLKLSGTIEEIKHKESQTGSKLTDLIVSKSKSMEVNFEYEESTKENLRLAFYGNTNAVAAGSVTAEVLPTMTSADVGREFKLAKSNVSSVVITNATPATVPAVSTTVTYVEVTARGSGYTSAPTVVFTGGGGTAAAATAVISNGKVVSITVTNSGSGYTSVPTVSFTGGSGAGAAATALVDNYVVDATYGTIKPYIVSSQPWSVAYSYGATDQISFMTTDGIEKSLFFKGINTVNSEAVIVQLFRCRFDVTKDFDLIGDDLGKFSMKAEVLIDPNKSAYNASSNPLGQFGYIENIP